MTLRCPPPSEPPARPASARESTTSAYEGCADCGHKWHGLTCSNSHCNCPGAPELVEFLAATHDAFEATNRPHVTRRSA